MALALECTACAHADCYPAHAAEALGAAAAVRATVGLVAPRRVSVDTEQASHHVESALGRHVFAKHRARGRQLTGSEILQSGPGAVAGATRPGR